MGALCGKLSKDDNFAGQGRTLDSAPVQPPTAPLPANKRVVSGPGRTLGEGSSSAGEDPRAAARKAAEQREQAAKAKAGKLGQQLRQQKAMTDNEVNKKANEDEAQRRLIEQRAETLNYN
ncbi:hypothetical protein N0V93_003642 [Gnomoniopsis smithogilvyi]|uniref:Uncharacterized protein n=1 Tax=Gnomoniopsis smithogilvyi TaxID=1191159 RepID=A0A9W9D0A9_9PEZI|nr:hypothetical protein N0V93_003642 [Gnomoniopsis smithogilvyi]